MPYIIRPRRVRNILSAVLGSAVLLGAVPAIANAACPKSTSSKLLAALGDTAEYGLLSGSTFESGASGWSLSSAELVSGSAYEVFGGSHAILIKSGGTLVSPEFCVSSEYPTFRFFTRQISSGSGHTLNVSLRYKDILGISHTTSVAQIQPSSSWTLSPPVKLASALPLWMPGSTLNVSLVLQASSGLIFQTGSGTWAVSDVFIDPYSR